MLRVQLKEDVVDQQGALEVVHEVDVAEVAAVEEVGKRLRSLRDV